MATRANMHCVTGKLAEVIVREKVAAVAQLHDFDYTVEVLPITVAALMTPKWIARHVQVPPTATQFIVPGYCGDSLDVLQQQLECPVIAGPRDIRMLNEFIGGEAQLDDYGKYDIEIIAEINHAPRLEFDEIRRKAQALRDAGADLVDIGCTPGEPWRDVGHCVQMLVSEGMRVSIDSFEPREIGSGSHQCAHRPAIIARLLHNVAAEQPGCACDKVHL